MITGAGPLSAGGSAQTVAMVHLLSSSLTRGVYMRARCATKEMASGVRMESYSWGMRPVMATPRRWLGAILTGLLQHMPDIMCPLRVHAHQQMIWCFLGC